jgi:hypothetical protein
LRRLKELLEYIEDELINIEMIIGDFDKITKEFMLVY